MPAADIVLWAQLQHAVAQSRLHPPANFLQAPCRPLGAAATGSGPSEVHHSADALQALSNLLGSLTMRWLPSDEVFLSALRPSRPAAGLRPLCAAASSSSPGYSPPVEALQAFEGSWLGCLTQWAPHSYTLLLKLCMPFVGFLASASGPVTHLPSLPTFMSTRVPQLRIPSHVCTWLILSTHVGP